MILKVENITKSFGRHKVLNKVSLEMNSSLLNGIVGENGSGKSTLLNIIVVEWNSDHGNVSVGGRIGYCPQKTLLFSQLTVDEHFCYFSAAYGIEKGELLDRSESLMDYFNLYQLAHNVFVSVRHLHMFIFGLTLIGFVYGCYGLTIGSFIKGKAD